MNTHNDVLDDPQSAETLPQLVRAAAATYGDDVAITLKGETIPDESLTFSELDRKSAELVESCIDASMRTLAARTAPSRR